MVRARLGREDDAARLDLDELEAEQDRDRRRRELAGDHRAHRGEAVELRQVARSLDGIVLDRRDGAPMLVAPSPISVDAGPRVHAASRRGLGSGGWGRIGRGSGAGVIAASQGKSASMVTSWPGMSCGVMVAAFVQGCIKKLSLRQRVA
jgi:L-aminopeptidase/D-esterase-like protein